jgi:hypothetical protein
MNSFLPYLTMAQILKLPATSYEESPTVKENVFCVPSLTPPQATGNVLAVQFKGCFQFINSGDKK